MLERDLLGRPTETDLEDFQWKICCVLDKIFNSVLFKTYFDVI